MYPRCNTTASPLCLLFLGCFLVRCDNVDGPTFYQRKSGSTESSWPAGCVHWFLREHPGPSSPRSMYSNRMFYEGPAGHVTTRSGHTKTVGMTERASLYRLAAWYWGGRQKNKNNNKPAVQQSLPNPTAVQIQHSAMLIHAQAAPEPAVEGGSGGEGRGPQKPVHRQA